jgi:hypothetical protein
MSMHYLSLAQLDAAMGALVAEATCLACIIPPEDQLLAHACHAHWLFFDLLGFHQNIPLVWYHEFSPLQSFPRLPTQA